MKKPTKEVQELQARVAELERALTKKTESLNASVKVSGAIAQQFEAKIGKPNLRIEKRLAKYAHEAGVLSLKLDRLCEKLAGASAEFMAAAERLRPPAETRTQEKNRLFGERYSVPPKDMGRLYDQLGTTRQERGAAKFEKFKKGGQR